MSFSVHGARVYSGIVCRFALYVANMAFTGDDLRALRERHAATVKGLAPKLGVHRNTWTRLEAQSGKEVPLTLRLALAAWVRGLPALGDEK